MRDETQTIAIATIALAYRTAVVTYRSNDFQLGLVQYNAKRLHFQV